MYICRSPSVFLQKDGLAAGSSFTSSVRSMQCNRPYSHYSYPNNGEKVESQFRWNCRFRNSLRSNTVTTKCYLCGIMTLPVYLELLKLPDFSTKIPQPCLRLKHPGDSADGSFAPLNHGHGARRQHNLVTLEFLLAQGNLNRCLISSRWRRTDQPRQRCGGSESGAG